VRQTPSRRSEAQAAKRTLLQQEFKYLDYVVGQNEVATDHEKVRAARD